MDKLGGQGWDVRIVDDGKTLEMTRYHDR